MNTYSVFRFGLEHRFYVGELKPDKTKGELLGYADGLTFPIKGEIELRNRDIIKPLRKKIKINPEDSMWKKAIFHAREGKVCFYCKEYLPLNLSTKDHVTPKFLGGGNHDNNLVLCCRKCNERKGKSTVQEFMEQTLKEIERLENTVKSCKELLLTQ
jgi:5-methylcytosine-specific restriction endonuclease McrA